MPMVSLTLFKLISVLVCVRVYLQVPSFSLICSLKNLPMFFRKTQQALQNKRSSIYNHRIYALPGYSGAPSGLKELFGNLFWPPSRFKKFHWLVKLHDISNASVWRCWPTDITCWPGHPLPRSTMMALMALMPHGFTYWYRPLKIYLWF